MVECSVAELAKLIVTPALRASGGRQCARMVKATRDLGHTGGKPAHAHGCSRSVGGGLVESAVTQTAEIVVAPTPDTTRRGECTRVIKSCADSYHAATESRYIDGCCTSS